MLMDNGGSCGEGWVGGQQCPGATACQVSDMAIDEWGKCGRGWGGYFKQSPGMEAMTWTPCLRKHISQADCVSPLPCVCVSRHRELEAIEGERLAMAKEEERMAALDAVKQAELRKRNLLHKLEIQTQV